MRKPRDIRTTVTAVAFTLGLHTLVLILFINVQLPSKSEPGEPVMIAFVSVPAEEPEIEEPDLQPEEMPQPEPPPPDPEPPITEAAPSQPSVADEPEQTPPEPLPERAEPEASELHRQALELARGQRDSGSPKARLGNNSGESLSFAPIPRLPGTAGWLNQFVGRVTPWKETWTDDTGEVRHRIVTASGRVYCSRRRGGERSAVRSGFDIPSLTYISKCGRERPPPPDPDDPWIWRPNR